MARTSAPTVRGIIATGSSPLRVRWWAHATALVIARPWLWGTAVAQVVRLAPTGWWRHRPFLPWPDADYVRFRLVTQYGGSDSVGPSQPDAGDLVEYLDWCRTVLSS